MLIAGSIHATCYLHHSPPVYTRALPLPVQLSCLVPGLPCLAEPLLCRTQSFHNFQRSPQHQATAARSSICGHAAASCVKYLLRLGNSVDTRHASMHANRSSAAAHTAQGSRYCSMLSICSNSSTFLYAPSHCSLICCFACLLSRVYSCGRLQRKIRICHGFFATPCRANVNNAPGSSLWHQAGRYLITYT